MNEGNVSELIIKKFSDSIASNPTLKGISGKLIALLREDKYSKNTIENVLKEENETHRT